MSEKSLMAPLDDGLLRPNCMVYVLSASWYCRFCSVICLYMGWLDRKKLSGLCMSSGLEFGGEACSFSLPLLVPLLLLPLILLLLLLLLLELW
jgi:hypothetical protein